MPQPTQTNPRRVVITGLGVISSLGIGWQTFWKNLLAGKSGISKITAFDTSKYDRHYAGEVKNFDPTQFIHKRKSARLGRSSQMAIAASKLALEDANVKLRSEVVRNMAVCIGTTTGEQTVIEEFDDILFAKDNKLINADKIFSCYSSAISSNVASEFNLQGRNIVFSTACAAGNYAIAKAFDLIMSGKMDYALAGGTDGFSRLVFTGFGRLYAIAPEKCQPFDKNRKGMIPGEGAGVLLLETLESAQKRNAKVYAEVLGYGLSCDANHMTHPTPAGIARAIKQAIENSQLDIEAVNYISPHGTGTLENDKAECQAIQKVFGKNTKDIPVSSVKSMLGHTMGAASALEAISCCLAMAHDEIPPTINYHCKDEACNIDCVPNIKRKHKINAVLNNSSAFGGNNACLALVPKS